MDRNPIKNKNYSIKELKDLFGEDYLKQIPGKTIIPLAAAVNRTAELTDYLNSKNILKKPILHFDDFNHETKKIYTKIKAIILESNLNQKDIKVWATGSRIYGTWRTKEEEDIIARANNRKPKYSDYDYCTNARNIPSFKVFMERLHIKTDFSDCGSDKKVLIP